MKLDSILCPVDFSEPSRRALACASSLADWYAARIVALHVAQPAHALAGTLSDGAFFSDEPVVDVTELRRQVRRELPAMPDGMLMTADVALGAPAEAIVAYADSIKPDLIVMGTRGTSGLRHLVLGSVTEAVLRASSSPVLAIPPGAGPRPAFPFRRVLCATDFSAASFGALRVAASLLQDALGDVTVMHVMDDVAEDELFNARPYNIHRYGMEREAQAQESLRQLVSRAFFGLKRQPELAVTHGDPQRRILAAASEMQADLIVIGVTGQNDLHGRIFGSTTNAVLRAAPCPVLAASA